MQLAENRRRGAMVGWVVALVLGFGVIDYTTGFEISFLVFYLLPVCLAAVSLGRTGGVITAVGSVIIWLVGDFAAGARYTNVLVPFWNALIALGTYLVVIWLVSTLLAAHREMEARVKQRTAALAYEIEERERLERTVLEIGERERRSIGHDLHDGLGQHLTGTALTGQILAEKLQERGAAEAPEAKKLVALVKSGIEQTRQLAKGLLLAEVDADGLVSALRELCANMAAQFKIDCTFQGASGVVLVENGAASHLYRIAQEAVRNAIRHGRAQRVAVNLSVVGRQLLLNVTDDGLGIPPPSARGAGLGLRIMEHRARIIGAAFSIEALPEGGTHVMCKFPLQS